MRNAVATIVVLLLCLALAPCVLLARTQPSLALSNVDDTKQGVVLSVVTLATSSSSGPEMGHGHRRSLKKASKSKQYKSKSKKTKWASTSKGQATLLGTVILVSVVVAAVLVCVVFLMVTEKKEQDPKWRIRDLFKRRVKPGVKRTLTRKKAGDDDMEKTKKLPEDGGAAVPPKLQLVEA